MKDALKLLAFVPLLVAITGCGELFPLTYHCRMTVEVDTPEGLRSGSSVIEVKAWDGIGFPSPEAGGIKTRVRGEAVAVNLPGGRLFVLLRTKGSVDAAAGFAKNAYDPVLPAHGPSVDWADRTRAMMKQTRPAVLPPRSYPMMVRFRDIRDPKTIEVVEPSDLAASFGRGTSLRRILITITDEEITTGVVSQFPFMGTGTGYGQWQQSLSNEDPRYDLTRDDFIKETGR